MTRKIFLAIAILIAGYVAFILGFHSLSVAYFEHKCDTQSGEFIYRVVKNVEGLYQMRLRDPKDYFDRLKRGDIPEDPFGHTNREAQNPETLFVNPPPRKYRYLETTRGPDVDDYERGFTSLGKRPAYTGEKYWIYYGYSQFDNTPMVAEQRSALKSRYGFTWREVRGFWDEVFRVYGGELLVMDMKTQEVLGLRRGFVQWERFSGTGRMCPKDKTDSITYLFVSEVLVPVPVDKDQEKTDE